MGGREGIFFPTFLFVDAIAQLHTFKVDILISLINLELCMYFIFQGPQVFKGGLAYTGHDFYHIARRVDQLLCAYKSCNKKAH